MANDADGGPAKKRKRLQQKKNTIIDPDSEMGKEGADGTSASGPSILHQFDSDRTREIQSRLEKSHRASIRQLEGEQETVDHFRQGEEAVGDQVSDAEDDGHFPHLLHLRYPAFDKKKIDVREITSCGLKVRKGMFTVRERERVQANMREIMHTPPVSDHWSSTEEYDDVFIALTGLFSDVKTESGLKKRHILGRPNRTDVMSCPHRAFYFRLGRGLPRRILSNIVACLQNRIPFRKRCSLTDEEIHHILETRRQNVGMSQIAYDNKVIPHHVGHVFESKLTPTFELKSNASFTFHEDAKIIRLVMRQLSLEKIEDYDRKNKVDWTDIAVKLKVRTRQDCYDRFRHNLRPLFGTEEMAVMQLPKKQIRMDTAKMLFFAYKSETECMLAMDWAALRNKIPHLPMFAAMRLFHDLVASVPKDEYFSFRESVEWLVENELPKLTKGKEKRIKELEDFYNAPFVFAEY